MTSRIFSQVGNSTATTQINAGLNSVLRDSGLLTEIEGVDDTIAMLDTLMTDTNQTVQTRADASQAREQMLLSQNADLPPETQNQVLQSAQETVNRINEEAKQRAIARGGDAAAVGEFYDTGRIDNRQNAINHLVAKAILPPSLAGGEFSMANDAYNAALQNVRMAAFGTTDDIESVLGDATPQEKLALVFQDPAAQIEIARPLLDKGGFMLYAQTLRELGRSDLASNLARYTDGQGNFSETVMVLELENQGVNMSDFTHTMRGQAQFIADRIYTPEGSEKEAMASMNRLIFGPKEGRGSALLNQFEDRVQFGQARLTTIPQSVQQQMLIDPSVADPSARNAILKSVLN
jgi:hypothetical protein